MPQLTRLGRALPALALVVGSECAHPRTEPGVLAPDDGGVVESRWENGHVFVRLRVGDQPIWLLLDSGASNTLVRPGVLAAIGARPLGDALMDGTVRHFPVRAFSGATLRADTVSIVVPTLYELPRGVPALDGVRGVDGIIGFELFSQARIVLDPQQHTVRVLALNDRETRARADLGFHVRRRVPVVDAELRFADGTYVRAPFIVDLGSNADIHLARSFAVTHELQSRLTDAGETYQAGLWAVERGAEGHAVALKIGHEIVATPNVFIGGDSVSSFAEPDVAGTIGLGVLQHFRLRFDYGSGGMSLRRINTVALRDSTGRACLTKAPRRPVVLRGGPTSRSNGGMVTISTDAGTSDSACPTP